MFTSRLLASWYKFDKYYKLTKAPPFFLYTKSLSLCVNSWRCWLSSLTCNYIYALPSIHKKKKKNNEKPHRISYAPVVIPTGSDQQGPWAAFAVSSGSADDRLVLEGGIDSVKDRYHHKYWWRSCMNESDQCEGLSTGTMSLAVINTFVAVGSATLGSRYKLLIWLWNMCWKTVGISKAKLGAIMTRVYVRTIELGGFTCRRWDNSGGSIRI